MKIGLYFGSFNPIHHGHLIIANHILHKEALDQVWFVVSPQNPFKENKTLLNEYQRLHLVNLAIEGERGFRVSDIEFGLPRPSYTIDTLTYLGEKYPEHEFKIIMGSDSFQNIGKWKSGNYILENHEIIVYPRPGHSMNAEKRDNVHWAEAPLLEISSTEIRQKIKKRESIRYWVPNNVMEEILKSGYYH